MAVRIKQERERQVAEVAMALGATVATIDEANRWDVLVGHRRAGTIRYHPLARVWLASTGTGTTVGDLTGCLRFVIHRC